MKTRVVRSKAPLRLGLAGGGTDVAPYSDIYGGAILNATISMYVDSCIEENTDGSIVLESFDRGIRECCTLDELAGFHASLDLHLAVYREMINNYNGGKPLPLRLTTWSDAPAGSGLGASSALVVAMIGAFREFMRLPLGEYEVAHLAYEVERIRLGLAGGKQDQYAATFGGFNFMEFYKDDKVIVNPLRVRPDIVNELEYNMLLFNTGKSHISSEIIERQVSSVQNSDLRSIEAMHHLKEQSIRMKNSILCGNIDEVGSILDYGWKNKRTMAGGITNALIDSLYETAISAGALGGKISGAGGGGFLMLYCDGDRKYEVKRKLSSFNGSFVDFRFTGQGLETWEKKT